jgi:hypothetical protein
MDASLPLSSQPPDDDMAPDNVVRMDGRPFAPVPDEFGPDWEPDNDPSVAPVGPAVEPVDLWDSFDPPDLPAGLLPEVIETFALTQGCIMGADPAGLAVAALVTCAAAIPDRIKVRVKVHDDWTEEARLWAALVGSPSTKKSPILSAATAPLCQIDRRLFAAWQTAMAEWSRLSKEDKAAMPQPGQTRLRIGDTTVEAAQIVLEGSPDGVLCLQDELSGFFGAMDKYNSGKSASADRAFWLQAYNGGEYAVFRVGRGVALIPNLSVSLLGGIQPEPIRKLAADAADDGLLQRILPIVLRPATLGRDEPRPAAAGVYSGLVERLHRLRPPSWMGGGSVTFTPAAQAIRCELEARHLSLQSVETVNRKLAAHIGKYDGLFARLCLVWHCIEHAMRAPDQSEVATTIGADTAQRVADFLHGFLLRHAFAFHAGTLGLSSDHDALTALAGFILARSLDRVTNRDVHRSGPNGLRGMTEREVRPLLEQMATLGWLGMVPGPRPADPPHWVVNPIVHRRFADRAERERKRRRNARATLDAMRGRGDG